MGTPDIVTTFAIIVLFATVQGLWAVKRLLKRYIRS